MSDKVVLTVEERTITGKKVKQLRKEGLVPAVMYGHGVKATPLMAPTAVAEKVWVEAGKHHPVELTIGVNKHLAMIKSAERDPVKHRLRHLSFHVVNKNEKVRAEVAVRIEGEGETEAEKAGLIVLKAIENVEIEALPNALPDFVTVPGAKFAAPSDHVTVGDITPLDGVTVLTEPEVIVATVYEPSALAAQNDSLAGDASEPTAEETNAEGTDEPEAAAKSDN